MLKWAKPWRRVMRSPASTTSSRSQFAVAPDPGPAGCVTGCSLVPHLRLTHGLARLNSAR